MGSPFERRIGKGKKTPYNTSRFIRNHMYWLIQKHEKAESCKVDWHKLSSHDIAQMVPDQTDQLQDIDWKLPVQAVAEYLGTHPLLVLCQLCLVHRVVSVPEKYNVFLCPWN